MKFLLASGLLAGCVVLSLAAETGKVESRRAPFPQKQAQPRDGAHHGSSGGHAIKGGGGHGGGHGVGHGGGGHDFGGGGHDFGGSHGSSSYSEGGLGGGHDFGHGDHGGFDDHHGGGHGISGGSSGGYGAPAAPSYGQKDTGFYYYYYPVVPEGNNKKKGGIFSGSKGFMGRIMETIMYPIMYPFMRAQDWFDGRSLSSKASDYLPMEILNKVAIMIEEEIYKEECLSRIICKLGKSAEGYETFLELTDYIVPEDYQSHLKTFKDSALKKSDCAMKYKCLSLDKKQF